MKYIHRKQSRIITGSTADEFQTKLNEALNEVATAGYKHEIQFNMALGFCAFIVFEETRQVPETLAEEYELRGDEYRCSECPMFVLSPDKRVKYTTCKRGCRKISANAWACDWFYKALEDGEVTPI